MIAARKENIGMVRKLIQYGASVSLTNKVVRVHSKCVNCNLHKETDPVTACPVDGHVSNSGCSWLVLSWLFFPFPASLCHP